MELFKIAGRLPVNQFKSKIKLFLGHKLFIHGWLRWQRFT